MIGVRFYAISTTSTDGGRGGKGGEGEVKLDGDEMQGWFAVIYGTWVAQVLIIYVFEVWWVYVLVSFLVMQGLVIRIGSGGIGSERCGVGGGEG